MPSVSDMTDRNHRLFSLCQCNPTKCMKIEARLLLESACSFSIYILWHHLEEVHPGIFSLWDKIHFDPSPLWHSERKFDWFIRPASPQPPFNETVIAHGRPALHRRKWKRGDQREEMWTEYVTLGTINPAHTPTKSEGEKIRHVAKKDGEMKFVCLCGKDSKFNHDWEENTVGKKRVYWPKFFHLTKSGNPSPPAPFLHRQTENTQTARGDLAVDASLPFQQPRLFLVLDDQPDVGIWLLSFSTWTLVSSEADTGQKRSDSQVVSVGTGSTSELKFDQSQPAQTPMELAWYPTSL